MLRKCLIETSDPAEFRKAVGALISAPRLDPIAGQTELDIRFQVSIVRNMKLTQASTRSGYVFSHALGNSDCFGIFFVKSGRIRFKRKGESVDIGAGAAYLAVNTDDMVINASAGSSLVYAEIPQARYASLASTHEIDPTEKLASLEAVASIEAHGLSIVEQMAMVLIGDGSEVHPLLKSPFAALQVKEAIVAAFIEYWPSKASTGGMTAYRGTVRRTISWLHEHLSEDFTIEDVARVAGVSMRGLQQAFKDEIGASPTNYVQKLRLQRVRQDLLDPSCPGTVKEIAFKWGFRHLGYFASRYRTLYGESPSETRKKRARPT
ncbi:helix-turn-helix transcriptional regulator [Rhizobium sp. PAMB 3182]